MKLRAFLVAVVVFVAVTLVSAGVMGLLHPAQAQTTTDYDADDDGLIEVTSAAQLNAIRWDLDGNGSSTNSTAYDAAFSNAATGMGCPSSGCTGYELDADIDLDVFPYNSSGWSPIGGWNRHFTATFDGNGNTISGLSINSRGSYIGLFGYVGSAGVIRKVGLTGVNVIGGDSVGGLAGQNDGTIRESSATVEVPGTRGVSGTRNFVGGLVGANNGTITASFATGAVHGTNSHVGGLVGGSNGTITASYATGAASGSTVVGGLVGANTGAISASYAIGAVSGTYNIGGLVGSNSGSISVSYATGAVSTGDPNGGGGLLVGASSTNSGTTTASYWDTQTSGLSTSDGGVGKTTSELQSPTGYSGIYANWNVDLDVDGTSDDPWDFGNASQYPVLDYGGLSVSGQRSSGTGPQATSTPTATPTPTPTPTATPTPATDYDRTTTA